MFSREFRLPSSVHFTQGMSYKHSLFLLKVAPNTLSHNRYGFVVSKRVDKSAVERNRVRRLFSSVCESLELKSGFDILVIVSPLAKEKAREDIEASLKEAFQKVNLL